MNTLTALDDFVKHWIEPKSDELEERVLRYIKDNKPTIADGFFESFREVCRRALTQQECNGASSVSYISYSLLYINLLARKPPYLIETFDNKWFFSDSICKHAYEPEWMTSLLYEFYDDALLESRKYLGRIHSTTVEKIILTTFDRQAKHLTRLAREIINNADLEGFEEYRKLRKEGLTITVGKYRGTFEEIYKVG